LESIYLEMIQESVTPDDFREYANLDFPDVSTRDEDLKYASIKPIIPDKISLKEYNRLQIEELMKYFRSKMNTYKDISNDDMKKFVSELITKRPSVVKKARLHLAATLPELFEYS
jgi:hypothetical protein